MKSGGRRSIAASRTQHTDSLNAPVSRTSLFGDQGSHFDHAQFTLNPSDPEWQVPGGRVSPVRHLAVANSGTSFHGSSLPFHANDAGYNTNQSVNAATRLQGLHSACISSVATTSSVGESLLGGTGLGSSSATPLLSRSASPQAVHQDTGNAHVSSQTVSPAVRYPYPFPVLNRMSMLISPKELQILDSGRRRPGCPTTNLGLPLAVAPTAVASSSSTGSPRLQSLPAGGLQGLDNPLAVESPSQTAVAGNGLSRAAEALSSRNCSLLASQRHSPSSGNANAALPVHGPSLSPSQGLLCHAAHLPMRLIEMILAGGALLHTLPVRQLLRNPAVLSWLVAFGLVSMLMVVAMSILPTQTQTQTPILANLPTTSMILLSLLSAASAHQRPRAAIPGGALDGLRSKPSSDRPAASTSDGACPPGLARSLARPW